jgi:hypothetical protein
VSVPEYHLSIDLEAELRKIALSQHLNRVHYMVQLVRHAVLLEPAAIRIVSDRRGVEFSQDGQPVSAREWKLLEVLLCRQAHPVKMQQEALTLLEERHGVALLSLTLSFGEVIIDTDNRRLTARPEGATFHQTTENVPGYRVRMIRPAAFRADEEREIVYFCSGMDVPLYFNGKRINAPVPFSGRLLTRRFAAATGRGAVGIPASGDLSAYEFFKNGIRFGVKQFMPADGRIVQGLWDSHLRTYEKQFRASIHQGEEQQRLFTQKLYGSLHRQFDGLAGSEKLRIKKVLLGVEQDHWPDSWQEIPLFHGQSHEYCFSLRDLLALKGRFGAIPFTARPDPFAPAEIPRLLPEDIFFLRNDLAQTLRLYQGGAFSPSPGRRLRHWLTRLRPTVAKAVDIPPRLEWLLLRLNEVDARHRFCFTRGRSRVIPDRRGTGMVYLSLKEPAVTALLDRLEREPGAVDRIRYALLALAAG